MSRTKRTYLYIVLKVTLAIVIAALLHSFPLYFSESLTYDARFRLTPNKPASPHIQTVAVDKLTIKRLKGPPSLSAYNKALQNLKKANPKTIIFLPEITNLSGSKKEKKEFAQLTNNFSEFIGLYDGAPLKGDTKSLTLPEPYSKIVLLPGVLSVDNSNFALDEVARRALTYYEGHMFLHPSVAQSYNNIIDPKAYRGNFDYKGSQQIYVNYRPAGTYQHISFMDLYNGTFSNKTFEDKIVILGTDNKAYRSDYVRSVYSRENIALSKLEAHAQILDTYIDNDGIIKSSPWIDFAITCVLSLITVFVVFGTLPMTGIVVIISCIFAFSLIGWLLFAFFGYAIGMAHTYLAIFITYYFFIPYRLIRESRQSWEYQQKNKLLTEVEELKTNFMRMMSHDLKTPLARIQGMATVALQDSKKLSPEQKEALKTITDSSEELTEFISSILDLSRVESEEVKLQLQSKDINDLLSDVAKRYEYLAQSKNIEIILELEPLFSVKIDPDLMKQVFGNLIENAIKYSEEGSKILVTTEEVNNNIIIQVADQGIGIQDGDIDQVFTKFYRTDKVKNSQTKGSGLGLYLAKYFVELHNGNISVESIPQKGSTFTVDIPTS